jgi:microcystin-dependent protein
MPDSSSAYLGDIFMAGFNFAPAGSALCQGQVLSISTYSALFALLGTTFGGDGVTTFALPDLRGRIPMGQGAGSGLSSRYIGEMSGTESVTLLTTQMPAHTHSITVNPKAVTEAGDTSVPTNAYPANTGTMDKEYKASGTLVNMGAAAVTAGAAGGSQPHDNMPPFLVLNFYIAIEGIFPSRN